MLLSLQNAILEMIARGEDLKATADLLCREIEKLVPELACSVLTIDAGGLLRVLAAPSLPVSYSKAIDGFAIGPNAGSCGTAAFRCEPVTVTDIETDPLWEGYRELVLPLGYRACWSSPIMARDGNVLGTFAFYYRTRRGPSALEQQIVNRCVHLCAIAMEREAVEARNRKLAFFDPLTGLGNRASFAAAMCQTRWAVPDQFGLILIDIDHLKAVNDTSGHATGDVLIQEVAARIASVAQPGRAYRIGGDEIAVVVIGDCASLAVGRCAADILAVMGVPFQTGGQTIIPSVTIGSAVYDRDGGDAETLRQNADVALYHAKENIRGGYAAYESSLGTTITQRFNAIRRVSTALEDARVEAHYQPIVRLDNEEVVGVEALCRLREAEGRLIPAKDFFQAMSDAQVACHLTDRMLAHIAADVRAWLDMGLPFQHVGINVTSADFQRGDIDHRILAAFEKHKVPLHHVILEVTESVYMGEGNDRMVAKSVEALRASGIRVALDDFGTGYASLTHLLDFPVDIIKIDKSFVDRLTPGDAGLAIVEGVIGIAEKLGIRIVAEGIETAAQATELLRLGCVLGQGYHYARPADVRMITPILQRRMQFSKTAGALSAA
ncbi:EAL domain-containing protein [Flaviflagellibacter deserti]|uniref:EAL domain-containing protein n=1 Tax=Flaviflagellibacter deserti TaxID=2267266 RepID=A0ABV9Z852_9HYPH